MEKEVGAKVVNGKIIIADGINREIITIKAKENVNLFINDVECEKFKPYEVSSKDKITYNCETTPAKREVNITISEDKMKAYMTVEYTPKTEYKIKDREFYMNLAVSTEVLSKEEPEYFTVQELYKKLKEKGIVFGIKEESLELILKGCSNEVLVAEGLEPVKDTPSEVKLFFTPTQMVFPEPDSNEKVDFKNLFRISNVNAGDKIAEIIPEIPGKNGMNIFGKVIEREYIRSLPIDASKGCKIENNHIISLIDGKAHIANRSVSVNPIYTVESVNMETCNIKFYGDVEVYDSVQDNMFVSAGGSLDVSQNVNMANVVTGGEITILGNTINSKILSGQVDIRKKEYSDVLTEFKNILVSIIEYINGLNLQNFERKDFGKTLTEKNFGSFQKVALNIISLNIKNKTKRSKLVDFIKGKILGLNILEIKSIYDLKTLLNILDNEIDYYDKNIIVPLDIRIGYCQECEIKSTGNIIIGGKGEYTSKLTAMKDIIFTRSDSVARGGVLSAGQNISLGVVGSRAYIPTTLMVPQYGRITAAKAYANTVFCFGRTKVTLDEDLKNINVYFNSEKRAIEFGKTAL
ncbi:polymerase [Clostridium beijerinckii]|uniref:Polymerase n=1 Tax=Clostridium beijerinckii TaxID=1520 RepID=A0A0B5QNX4_CLOBE|nr:FapA family protein [Clostridium beijerinckii]AJG99672.2 polymerase [Clostridium beijerinckii]